MAKKTTKQFIDESISVHGNRYNYSSVNYINNKIKVTIICNKHGEFLSIPSAHLHSRSGCPKCAIDNRKSTLEEFVEKSNRVHMNKYDYSKTKYFTNKIPVKIICKIHGEFQMRPDVHIFGKEGCKECGIVQRAKSFTKSQSEFLEMCKDVHGNKYDYSKSFYHGMYKKVKILCNCCKNEFMQNPNSHIYGRAGCPFCSGNVKIGTFNFVKKSKKIHGNKYDYSESIYVDYYTKVKIFCNTCRSYFFQLPASHTSGYKSCNCSNTKPLNNEKFIEQCRKIHGDKYDYSLVNYINNRLPVVIICKECKQEFKQKPAHHMRGSDCPLCCRNRYISKIEANFFNCVGIKITQKKIGDYYVDGYDRKTNTVYEFLGDYWHGNPKMFNPNTKNIMANKYHRELYLNTVKRFRKLKFLGYKVNYIWENDYRKVGVSAITEYKYGLL
jgi:hypothetical protein